MQRQISSHGTRWQVWIDRGGTFTDIVAKRPDGTLVTHKRYTRSLGNWLFIVVLITIGPLATTELGTDGWMPDLLKLRGPDFPNFATWIFVYVSVIMTVLRFYADPVVHTLSPIGLLEAPFRRMTMPATLVCASSSRCP